MLIPRCLFDRGTFGVFLLTYCYLPKAERARAHLFPQPVKINTVAGAPYIYIYTHIHTRIYIYIYIYII